MDILAQLLLDTLVIGSIYALFAVSFSLTYSLTKFYNLSYCNNAVISAYTVLYFTETMSFSLQTSIVIGLFVAALFTYIQLQTIFYPLQNKKASPMRNTLASLGLLIAVREALVLLFTNQFKSLSKNIGLVQLYQIGGGVITLNQLVIVIASLVLLTTLILFLNFTHYGTLLKTISSDILLAKTRGINIRRIVTTIYILDGIVIGSLGILIGFDTGIKPSLAFDFCLKGIGACLLFNPGSIWGAFFGAYILGFVENFGVWIVSGDWKDALSYSFIILVLILKKQKADKIAWNI